MELALYCPEFGYYERSGQSIGRSGDFYTNISTGSLFGQLLAYQFKLWLEQQCDHILWIEGGGHDGQLAADMLTWVRINSPEFSSRLEYWLLEPSAARRKWQKQTLDKFAGQVHWAESFSALPHNGITGIIFSNELLDAFPVHRLRWSRQERTWLEWGVGLRHGKLEWQLIRSKDWTNELQTEGIEWPPDVMEVVPDGFAIEFSPAASDWWRQAACVLSAGKLLTIDYGLTIEELLAPERASGTLRSYYRHHPSVNPLEKPGEQDLTAHINFTQLQRAGEKAGLRSEGLFTQAQFLTSIARQLWKGQAPAANMAPQCIRQFQTLTHPEHLGRAFRVLVQSR